MSKTALEEHYKELDLSTFSKPILKEMGIKALFLVIFDIIIGPIAYICKLTPTKIDYLEFLKDLAHLGEFYTGISHGQIDKVTTRSGEEMIVGRATRKTNETELIDVAVALVDSTEYQPEIAKMLKFAVRTAYGKPRHFSQLIDKVCLEYQDIKKKNAKFGKGVFNDLGEGEKQQNLTKLFKNWFGILFVDFEGKKVNSSFLPDWIEGNKFDPIEIASKVSSMYVQGVIIPKTKQSFTIVSLKGRQLIIVSTTNLRFCTIIFPTQIGLSRINTIVKDFDALTDGVANIGLNFNTESMKKTLEILDKRATITAKKNENLMKETLEIMIKADSLTPKRLISVEEYRQLEGEFQQKYFRGMRKAYQEFDGMKSIYDIAYKVNVSLDKLADFVLFCKTRAIVQIFALNGQYRRQ